MSTGKDAVYIGTRYAYYNSKRKVQFCGTSMTRSVQENHPDARCADKNAHPFEWGTDVANQTQWC